MSEGEEQSEPEQTPEAKPVASKLKDLVDELESLRSKNAEDAVKYEGRNSSQVTRWGFIVGAFTIFGIIIGFGLLSIVTGIGGFIVGVGVASLFERQSPEHSEYEARKLRIIEIEEILGQYG